MNNNLLPQSGHKVLNLFSLIMITVGSVDSIRNLPTIALFGAPLVFFFVLAFLFFLLPSALFTAELASAWPEQGGIYAWVRHGFGKKIGFLAIWFQWVSNVIWYPTILSFIAATLGYLIAPELTTNKLFIAAVVVSVFWGTTAINFFGMRLSSWISSICAVVGLLLPMALIIGLGVVWFYSGQPMQIHFTAHSFLPHFNDPDIWLAFTGIIMSFCGIEVATVHAQDVKNPERSFPRALLIATIILVVTLICGALAVAMVLPGDQISLVAGIMQTFHTFFIAYHIQWIMPLVAVVLVLGSLGGINNWIIAPTKGLAIASKESNMLKHFVYENKHRTPHLLLIYQAVIVTLLMLVFVLMPTVTSSYWLLTALAAQLYMLMYILLFAAGIRLRFKEHHRHVHRPFRIPGRNLGIVVLGVAGIIGALLTFAIGFVPPHNILGGGSVLRYEAIIISGLLLMSLPPVIIHNRARRRALSLQEANV